MPLTKVDVAALHVSELPQSPLSDTRSGSSGSEHVDVLNINPGAKRKRKSKTKSPKEKRKRNSTFQQKNKTHEMSESGSDSVLREVTPRGDKTGQYSYSNVDQPNISTRSVGLVADLSNESLDALKAQGIDISKNQNIVPTPGKGRFTSRVQNSNNLLPVSSPLSAFAAHKPTKVTIGVNADMSDSPSTDALEAQGLPVPNSHHTNINVCFCGGTFKFDRRNPQDDNWG